MKFADLDERAKNRARGRWRECELEDDWWDGVYEDAVTIGALMGCEVGENVTRTVGGHPAKQYDISFSGFCSQGDGACWSGFLDTAKLAGAVERMRAHVGSENEALLGLAAQAEELHALLATVQVANRLSGDEANRDWPDIEVGMRIVVDRNEQFYSAKVDTSLLPDEIEKAADTFVDDFAGWIYTALEAEHDYRLDNAQIDAAIESDDPDFDEDGNTE